MDSIQPPDGVKKENELDTPADFETAIKACGYGKFHILLLIVAMPAIMGTVYETGVVSYILPSAECDLSLDLLDKGLLNATTYCGMLVSAVAWGYLADNKGRKKLLIYGFLLDGICVLCGSMSQTVVHLMVSKFIGGMIICGPFAILMSYLSEFHGSNHRSRIIMVIGIMFAISNIILTLMAIAILPRDWNFEIFHMKFVSWKVFMAVSGVPSLLAALLLPFFPESPRFLMSQGRNKEALQTFESIYALNSGKPKTDYKVKKLVEEKAARKSKEDVEESKFQEFIIESGKQSEKLTSSTEPNTFRILCSKPHLGLCLLVCVMQFFSLMGHNSMRLWLPQLFASINEYEMISSEATSMCTILEYGVNKTEIIKDPTEECTVKISLQFFTASVCPKVKHNITLIVSLTMVVERMGTILGNVIFPMFMSVGCIPPFVMITAAMYIGCIIAAFLPNAKRLDLK
ncbi:synaptic vesicle glycoprotein 2B-like [Haematobia irritans]|uniref:synaptic vesicle glycoprotein 2B-like n=1 Tax=Haematobia irritans TaxID=7368 RepID=UPI003F4FFE1E